MARIFGFDIGTTSIGFAVIDHEVARETGTILRLGVRIFPEARDPDGTPLNQTRRQKRMMRRQLRRRRIRRRVLNEHLTKAGLLPPFGTAEWQTVMKVEPLELRVRGLSEPLEAHDLGHAFYHLAQHRHFKGRELEETEDEAPDEKEAKTNRESTLKALRTTGHTLGQFLSKTGERERQRGIHANRTSVSEEFNRLWNAQATHHEILRDPNFRALIEDTIFAQRPVFWRKNTLGSCRFIPDEALCPKGSWLSHQRRMLEKLNNLEIVGGNARPLDDEERGAILQRLQVQGSMSWGGARDALKPLAKARGEVARNGKPQFNLEVGGEPGLTGNPLEAKLADIFGGAWTQHAQRQGIRDAIHQRLWAADYGEIGDQRVVIRSAPERKQLRTGAAQSFVSDFAVTADQAARLEELKLASGWEPYSAKALEQFLPHLEAGVKFGALVVSPDWQEWRATTFPNREQPTGEFLDRLPSPADREEQKRITSLRNPTVIRTQNELRKVVNNLIGLYGKPDLIRVELTRDVGKSKREREEMKSGLRKQEVRRKKAAKDLTDNGIEPARRDIEKWMLWKESGERCPYTGDQIGFDDLFRNGEYEVEHIWPRSRSLDDSFRNKTLCRRDVNVGKGNETPFEHFEHRPDEWAAIARRVQDMVSRGGDGMSLGKAQRFLAQSMPDDFASRQLNDTGFAARQAVTFLKRLWPDVGPEAPVTVQAVSGRVTAQLRKVWRLNNILSDDGEKSRADHRHHAIDALVIACAHPGVTQKLSTYWQDRDNPAAPRPQVNPPWPNIRASADVAAAQIVVSHRVRKKVSGPLHKETTYGDTGEDVINGKVAYRKLVTRKKVEALSKNEVTSDAIRDPSVRKIIQAWVADHGGDPKKAFANYPRIGAKGPEIRRVRLVSKQQIGLLAKVSTGFADLGSNHHVAIYKMPSGKVGFEVISLFEASRRLAKREPVVRRMHQTMGAFVMSLAQGDAISFAKEKGAPNTLWRVQKISGNGQISLLDLRDASPAEPSLFEPTVGGLDSRGAMKLSIDPIGRIRPAND